MYAGGAATESAGRSRRTTPLCSWGLDANLPPPRLGKRRNADAAAFGHGMHYVTAATAITASAPPSAPVVRLVHSRNTTLDSPPSVSFFSLFFFHSRSADLDPTIRFHIRYPIQRPVRHPSLTFPLLPASRDRAPRHDVPVYLRYRRGVGVGR